MKKLSLLFAFIFIETIGSAQKPGTTSPPAHPYNDTIPDYYRVDPTIYPTPDTRAVRSLIEKNLRGQKITKKVLHQFEYLGKKMSAEVSVMKSGLIQFEGDIRYTGNNQVFAHYNKNSRRIDASRLFHENGKIWYQVIKNDPMPGMSRTEQYGEDGRMLMQFNNFISEQKEEMAIGEITPGGPILNAPSPSFFPLSTDYLHFGYQHAGNILASDGTEISGFFYPLKDAYLGRSSLLYFKNKDGKTGYWAIVVGNEIEQVFDDPTLPQPDIFDILTRHGGEEYTITRLNKAVYQDKLKGYKLPRQIYADIKILNFGPTDPNYTGYGMRYTTRDNPFIGDERNIEVGFFKNGKLNGPGVKIFIGLNMYYNERIQSAAMSDKIDIKSQMGIFADGEYVKGREFAYTQANVKLQDFYTKPEHPNIYYRLYSSDDFPREDEDKIPVGSLKPGDKIYLPTSKRTFECTRIDKRSRRAYFVADKPGEEISVGAESGNIYYKYSSLESVTTSCPKYVLQKQYKKVPLEVKYNQPASIRREVAGAYGTRVYLTQYSEEKTLYLGTRNVQDGVKQVVCSKCNGKGYVSYPSYKTKKILIDFEEKTDAAKEAVKAKEIAEKPTEVFNKDQPLYVKEVSSNTYYFYQNNKRIQDPDYYLLVTIVDRIVCYYKADGSRYFSSISQKPEADGKIRMNPLNGSYLFSSISKEKQTFVFEGRVLKPQDYELITSRSGNSLFLLKSNSLAYELPYYAFPKLSETSNVCTRNSYQNLFLLFRNNGEFVVVMNGKIQPGTNWKIEETGTESFLISTTDGKKYSLRAYNLQKADIIKMNASQTP